MLQGNGVRRTSWRQRATWLLAGGVLLALVALGGRYAWGWHHYLAAQAALAEHRNPAARNHVGKSLVVWPESAELLLMAARAERRAAAFDRAETFLDRCRRADDPAWADQVALEWALLRASMGDLRTVEQPLQARLLGSPAEAPLIWEALAEGYRRNFRMPEALRTLDTWIHFEPENAHVYFLRGEVHRQVGALSRAATEYRRVLELEPEHAEARRRLASALVQVGRYQEAADHLEQLRRASGDDPELGTLLARSKFDSGEREEAVQILDEVLRKHPTDGGALRERGRIALAAADFAAAERLHRQAVDALPHDYESHWGLYRSLQALGKLEEAKEQLVTAQRIKDASERIHEIQTHQMTLRPHDAALHAELGELLVQLGQEEGGEKWLLSALSLDPQNATARDALLHLNEASDSR
jgi:tetratricopeptide (TPR) repeat protein